MSQNTTVPRRKLYSQWAGFSARRKMKKRQRGTQEQPAIQPRLKAVGACWCSHGATAVPPHSATTASHPCPTPSIHPQREGRRGKRGEQLRKWVGPDAQPGVAHIVLLLLPLLIRRCCHICALFISPRHQWRTPFFTAPIPN